MSADTGCRLSLRCRVSYPGFSLDVDRDIELDGVTGLFGPSGGGKSTLLRIIAGFERAAEGRVVFNGDIWQDSTKFVPAHRRPVGYVFQDARLFPHLTVDGNLQFALKRNRIGENRIEADDVISIMDLAPLLHRHVDALSGGERQRVAIARTLLSKPRLLLLDEPLAALDVGRKREILPYIETLSQRTGIPAIYVSHAVDEVARLSDNVVVLEEGRITALGSAEHILNREDLQSSVLPFEAVSILQVNVIEHLADLHLTHVDHKGQKLTVPTIEGLNAGESARVYVRSGDVVLATCKPEGLSVRNVLAGTVVGVSTVPDSAFASVSVDVDGAVVKAQLTDYAVQELDLRSGQNVYVLVKTAAFDRGV